MSAPERADAEALDAADPLASLRARFVIDDPATIYLDGNSLGRLPAVTRERLAARAEEWGSDLVSAWERWIDLPERVGDALAGGVLGARPGEVIVSDSTTVNLYKLAAAALDLEAGAIVTDSGNFPTDRYVLEGIARARGGELRTFAADLLHGPQPDDVARACAAGDVSLVCLSHVAYRSGALADLAGLTAAAREHGARVLWDLSHSAGAVAVELQRCGAELAVGCTYKYLNAGPGAPAFLYVSEELQPRLRSPIQGWFGQREQFAMERGYEPEAGVRRFLAGTPPILELTAVEVGADLVAEAGVEALRVKGSALTALIVELHDAWLAPLGFELGTPRDPGRRGAHVALRHPEAAAISRALRERAGVIVDFRGPDSIRLGVPALYTRFTDVFEALQRLSELVADGGHRGLRGAGPRVT
jgi:kynureninase